MQIDWRKWLTSLVLGSSIFATAYGQSPQAAIKQSLLQRQQQQDELALKIQQSQQLLQPRLNERQKSELSQLHLQQQMDQQEQQSQQLQRQVELTQSSRTLGDDGQRLRLEIQLRGFDRDRDVQSLQFDRERKAIEQEDGARRGSPAIP
jgi:hypothetical protein